MDFLDLILQPKSIGIIIVLAVITIGVALFFKKVERKDLEDEVWTVGSFGIAFIILAVFVSALFAGDVRKAKEEYVKEYIGSFTDEELDSLIDYIQEDKESDKDKNTKNTENTIGELLWFIGFLVIAAVIFSKFA